MYRTPSQFTLEIAAGSGFRIMNRESQRGVESAMVRNSAMVAAARPENVPGYAGADVFDPGAFDPAALQRGEKITVGGRPAFFTTGLTLPDGINGNMIGGATTGVGWQTDQNAWVVVAGDPEDTREQLLQVAEGVRLHAPEQARAPFRFTGLPAGQELTFLSLTGVHVQIGFGEGGVPSVAGLPRQLPLSAHVYPTSNPDWSAISHDLGEPTVIGDFATWYPPRPNGTYGGTDTGADMIVRTGGCVLELHTDNRMQITRQDLTAVVEHTTIGDCTDPAGWLPPIG
ncbi:hypothetical protein [Actinoplanes sp. NBRC 101535]|uniref:hypothetical protein n=1 Tax=Actinoplanes sp. NBRC 101535 TaxID=3032196 RepID=UPI0024A1AD45|nr:hypothetical protein [Actinoplanes sp. NBRC 101535]GLY00345.1 hypothetical protein Acsp01_07240 [Actinoplanes sp. NBRC 101535]